MISTKRVISLVTILMVAGCAAEKTAQLPRYARPPVVVRPTDWAERLPRGQFRTQKAERISMVLTGDVVSNPKEAEAFLKAELKKAIAAGGSGDLPFHYYIDGVGNIYQGRSIMFEGAPPNATDTKGVVWIGLLDYRVDIEENDRVKNSLLHLLTYLCIEQKISPDAVTVASDTKEAGDSLLFLDLNGPDFNGERRQAFDEAKAKIDIMSGSEQWEKTWNLRINESEE